MSRNLQLNIPEPCHQDWHTMRPEEKGRFCSSCSKTVVDFSLMTDKEVLAHLADAGSRTCGRFASDQLNRNLMPQPERKRSWSAVWQLALATFLVSTRAEAQMGKPKVVVHQVDKKSKPGLQRTERTPQTMGLVYRIPDPAQRFIVISVIDSSTRQPVPNATIRLAGEHSLTTDSMGRSRLTAKMVDGARELEISSIGYGSQKIALDDKAFGTSDMSVKLSPIFSKLSAVEVTAFAMDKRLIGYAGGVSIGITVDTLTNILDTVRNWLTDTLAIPALQCQAINVYPNPVPRGSTIRIVMRPQPAGVYKLALYNTSGARIQERIVELAGKQQVELWNIPSSLASGVYLIELCSPGLERIYTGKLIVE